MGQLLGIIAFGAIVFLLVISEENAIENTRDTSIHHAAEQQGIKVVAVSDSGDTITITSQGGTCPVLAELVDQQIVIKGYQQLATPFSVDQICNGSD